MNDRAARLEILQVNRPYHAEPLDHALTNAGCVDVADIRSTRNWDLVEVLQVPTC